MKDTVRGIKAALRKAGIDPEAPTCSIEQGGRAIGVSRNTAYEAARRGELPTVTVGRTKRVVVPRLIAKLNGEGTN